MFIIYGNEEYLLQEMLQDNKGGECLAAAGKRGWILTTRRKGLKISVL